MGKILLAFGGHATFEAVTRNKLTAFTDKTIISRVMLKAECQKARKQGFAIDNEEITRGRVCMAAPVFGADGLCAGAIKAAVIKQAAQASLSRSLDFI